jgi:hypothetical protein
MGEGASSHVNRTEHCFIIRKLYCIQYRSKGASQSVSDVDRYVAINDLQYSTLSILPGGKFKPKFSYVRLPTRYMT